MVLETEVAVLAMESEVGVVEEVVMVQIPRDPSRVCRRNWSTDINHRIMPSQNKPKINPKGVFSANSLNAMISKMYRNG